jgi:hypothetical protein
VLPGLKSLATLVVLAVVVVGGAAWGWNAVSKPFPPRVKAQPCSNTQVKAGQKVAPVDVTVSVLNASAREGLAGRTMDALVKFGFGQGNEGNVKANIGPVQIWASDPKNPAVVLVKSWLPGAKVVKRTYAAPGVIVVVGQSFTKVKGGMKQVTASEAATICTPVVDDSLDD